MRLENEEVNRARRPRTILCTPGSQGRTRREKGKLSFTFSKIYSGCSVNNWLEECKKETYGPVKEQLK